MENVDQNFPGLTNEAQNNNFDEDWLISTENSYEHMLESLDFKSWIENFEKPLANELEILRYSEILKEQCNLDENQNLFDAADEAEKIRSGYYIDIHESLNIFKEFHNFEEENPFAKVHEEALEYLKMFQNDEEMPPASENVNFDFGNISGNSDHVDSDATSDISLLNVSDYEFEPNSNQEHLKDKNIVPESDMFVDNVVKQEVTVSGCEVTVNTDKKHEKTAKKKLDFNVSSVNKKHVTRKQNKKQKKRVVAQNFSGRVTKKLKTNKLSKMSPKITRKSNKKKINTSTPKKSLEKTFQNLPLSPILPSSVDYRSLTNFSSQEFQLLEDEKYLEYLKKQFFDGVFEVNGRTVFPIITNCNFKGLMYDLEDELINSETFITEIFFGLNFWRS